MDAYAGRSTAQRSNSRDRDRWRGLGAAHLAPYGQHCAIRMAGGLNCVPELAGLYWPLRVAGRPYDFGRASHEALQEALGLDLAQQQPGPSDPLAQNEMGKLPWRGVRVRARASGVWRAVGSYYAVSSRM